MIALMTALYNIDCPRGILMIAFMCLKQTANWTSCTHQLINSVELASVPGKTLFSPLRLAYIHSTFLIIFSQGGETVSETHQIISFILVTCYKRFLNPPWSQISLPFEHLKERHFSRCSGGPAELLNPGLMEFLGWLLLRSLPFKATSARATASHSKTDGGSQIKHFASYSLQMYPCAIKNGSSSFCWL